MNSFNLTLYEKHFICPSILSDSFAGQSNLGCRSFHFMSLNTSFIPLLACKVYFEKSADGLMGTPSQVTVSFSLAASKILYLSLVLGNLIMMCLMCASLDPTSLGLSELPGLLEVFARLVKFSFILFSIKFSTSCSSSSPSGTPMIQMLARLEMSQRLLILYSFLLFSLILVSSFCFI